METLAAKGSVQTLPLFRRCACSDGATTVSRRPTVPALRWGLTPRLCSARLSHSSALSAPSVPFSVLEALSGVEKDQVARMQVQIRKHLEVSR